MRKFLRFIPIALIRAYRLLLSPFVGQHCRFHPTCSHYAEQAIQTHGFVKGGWLALRRLGRCHPWHPGGVDPVPPTAQRPADEQEKALGKTHYG